MDERTRRALTRTAAAVLLLGLLAVGAVGLVAPSTPLGAVLEGLRSATGRVVVTTATVLLAGFAAALAWRPGREDVTVLVVAEWARLGPLEEPDVSGAGTPSLAGPVTEPRALAVPVA